jgi:hypothetical protein
VHQKDRNADLNHRFNKNRIMCVALTTTSGHDFDCK